MANAATTWTMGDRMAKSRKVSRVTVGDMAARQGVSDKTINNWERGRTHPKRAALELWASVTGFPFEWLLYGDAWLTDEGNQASGWTFYEAA
jgi:DNA-binding transcriptional regulator YiaG